MSFQAYLDNIKEKTGKTPEDFKKLAEKKGLLKPPVKAGDIVAWLKEDFALGHGHAMAVYAVLKSTEQPILAKDDAIDKHFAGKKASWRKVYDDLLIKLKKSGDDIQVLPTNSYLSVLRGSKKIAVVQTANEHMDIGIKLKDAEENDRFKAAGSWNTMMTHRVRIGHGKEVDKELMKWLLDAYEQGGAEVKKGRK